MITATHSPSHRNRILRLLAWGGAACLLLLPLVAMRFTREVDWDETDFIIFGTMLACACGAFELAIRAAPNLLHLLASIVTIGTAFLMVWATLAVGFVGDEGDPMNLMYAGLLLILMLGTLLAKFGPASMSEVLALVAAAQFLAGIAALAKGYAAMPQTLVFTASWVLAAFLFALAERKG